MSRQRIMIPEAFKVLPPLSPELPAPPRAPPPHRVAPPVARREKTAFVILNDEAPPHGRSRDNSPNGRVSPFRGRGFREETSRHASREPSPSPDRARKILPPRARSRSTSRLPVATPRALNGSSISTSPPGVNSGIPKPINRRNSLSPNRATQVLNQVNRNKSIKLPSQGRPVIIKPVTQSPRHTVKSGASPKRVGPSEISKSNVNGVSTKPPIPKIVQGTQNQKNGEKENDKRSNVTSPYRRRPPQNKPDVVKSPSRIPRTRSVSRGREGNVRASSPVRAVVRTSLKLPQGSTKPAANGDKKSVPNSERRNINVKKNVPNLDKKKNATTKTTTPSVPSTPVDEKPKLNLELDNKVPTPIEAVVSTLPGADDKTPELEKKEIQEAPIEVKPQPQVQSPPPTKPAPEEVKKSKPEEPQEVSKDIKETKEEVPEPSITLVRTTTAPALELAQPDVIPTILSKGEQEISKSISEGPSEEDKDENPGGPKETLASVESVRSNSSVETVRAATKAQGRETEVEVLSANNLMKTDGHTRNVAWDKEPVKTSNGTKTYVGQFTSALRTPDMSPLNNSVHPLDPSLPLQPPKPTGCCGRLCDKLCCRTPDKVCCCIKTPNCCSKLGRGLGALCSKLNCCKKMSCSSCCGKTDNKAKPKPARHRSRLRDCLSRLNCFRWSKCCRKSQPPPPRDVEEGEEGGGCCAGCKYRSCGCFRALFCLNRACCQRMRACCRCTRFGCCRSGGCCGPTPPQLDRRKSRLSVRKSQTSITQGIPKLDPTLVEHQSMMRGAVPVLPVPLAWLCCILNVFLPGSGTLLSGVFCLCFGKPRFSVNDSYPSRLTAFLINLVVSVSQLFTIIFCLVGWGWSIWWGVMIVRFSKKHKRILLAERAAGDQPAAAPVAVNQNHDVERAR